MAGRYWGLNRTQTFLLLAAVVIVSVVVALILGPSDDRPSDDRRTGSASVERIRVGAPGSPRGVWAFGFETLRFDPALTHPRQLAERGFGTVLGTPGAVLMYDPGTGRVGRLDATRNRLGIVASLEPAAGQAAAWAPALAARGTDLWVVPAPGQVARVDLATGRTGARAELPGPGPTATGVAAAAHAVLAATLGRDAVTVALLDPVSAEVRTTWTVPLSEPGATLDGLATDGRRAWVLTGQALHTVDLSDATVGTPAVLADQAPGAARGLVEADGSLWVLTDGGATLTRVDPATGTARAAARLLDVAPPALRLPAALVTDGRRVHALVQATTDPDDYTTRVVGYDTRDDRVVRGVEIPNRILAGAIAAT